MLAGRRRSLRQRGGRLPSATGGLFATLSAPLLAGRTLPTELLCPGCGALLIVPEASAAARANLPAMSPAQIAEVSNWPTRSPVDDERTLSPRIHSGASEDSSARQ